LLNFDAKAKNDRVDLYWTTASEINNDYFTIERSLDGDDFEAIGRVKGAGNSNTQLHYSAIDEYPYKGVSYYRLKQTDYDGKYTYSDLVAVTLNSNQITFEVYPNPSIGIINIILTGVADEEVSVKLYNYTGDIVSPKVILTKEEGYETTINTSKLAAGVYMLVGSNEQDIFRRKIVVY